MSADRWVNFYDSFEPVSPVCLPVPDFLAWLRDEQRWVNPLSDDLILDGQGFRAQAWEEMLVPPDIVDFFEQAAELAACRAMFRGPDNDLRTSTRASKGKRKMPGSDLTATFRRLAFLTYGRAAPSHFTGNAMQVMER